MTTEWLYLVALVAVLVALIYLQRTRRDGQ
jgi:hypothetical protein